MSAEARPSAALALFAAALVLLPAPTAMAQDGTDPGQDDGSLSYVEDWRSLKADLAAGNVSDARATYQAAFADAAANRTGAQADIEAGLDAAANASGPDATAYVVASQQVRKSLLAVAWANVQAAVDDGDGDRAAAWAEILGAKFGGDVATEADLLANASTADELGETEEELAEALRDVVTRKVAHEAEETPGLVEAGSDEAPAEAAEARYYASTILPHVETVLGANASHHLKEELDELLEAALNGDADTASAEAEEIVGALAEYTLRAAPREKAEAHATFKDRLEARDVPGARAVYQDELAEDVHEYAPDAHQQVLDALDAAENASQAGDEAAWVEAEQLAAKGVLAGAHEVAFTEFEEQEFHEALEWYAVVAAKFGWFEEPSRAAFAAGEAAALNEAGEAVDRAKKGTNGKFLDKVREEVEEVFINWDDPVEAREKAAEGLAYYQPARDRVVTVLGASPDKHLNEELEELLNATAARDRPAAREAANETIKLLDQVEAGGGEVTELDSLLSDLRGKVEFVLEEWRGYHKALDEGNMGEAETEKGEAIAFAQNARDRALDNQATLEASNAEATADLLEALRTLPSLVQDGNSTVAEVGAEVDTALDALDRIKAGEPQGNVTVALGPAEAGDAPRSVRVPVRLTELPEGQDVAFAATITYDTTVANATDVEIDAQVGASDLSPGEVRFNAALTSPGASAQVATLVFQATQAPEDVGEVSLDVEVRELSNSQGDPIGLEGVEGDTVDLAQAASTEASGTPGPGTLLALAVLAAGALGLAALRRRVDR